VEGEGEGGEIEEGFLQNCEGGHDIAWGGGKTEAIRRREILRAIGSGNSNWGGGILRRVMHWEGQAHTLQRDKTSCTGSD